jgi:hypothetical protein
MVCSCRKDVFTITYHEEIKDDYCKLSRDCNDLTFDHYSPSSTFRHEEDTNSLHAIFWVNTWDGEKIEPSLRIAGGDSLIVEIRKSRDFHLFTRNISGEAFIAEINLRYPNNLKVREHIVRVIKQY